LDRLRDRRVHLPEPKSSSTREPRKRETTEAQKSVLPRPPLKKLPKALNLTRVVRQFIEANRAPWQEEKDF